jgi:hypothetical protein
VKRSRATKGSGDVPGHPVLPDFTAQRHIQSKDAGACAMASGVERGEPGRAATTLTDVRKSADQGREFFMSSSDLFRTPVPRFRSAGAISNQAREEFRDVLSGAEPEGRSSLAEERRRPAEAEGVAAAMERARISSRVPLSYPPLHEGTPRNKGRRGAACFRAGRTMAAAVLPSRMFACRQIGTNVLSLVPLF